MKKVLVFGGRKFDKAMFDGYEVIVEKKVDRAIKRVFAAAPDVIISDVATTTFQASYYLKSLIEKIEVTQNIPFAIFRDKNLQEKFDLFTQVETKKDIDTLVNSHPLTDAEKQNISGYKLTNSCLRTLSTQIMDKMLVESSVLSELKELINYMNDEYALCYNIYKLIDKYVSYDLCGLYFNESKEAIKNIMNLSLPKGTVTINQVEKYSNKFFDEFDKYKRIEQIQTALVTGDVAESVKVRKFNTEIVVPYEFSENLTGGIYLLSKDKLNVFEKLFFDVITHELDVIFKLKYMFNEQAKHSLIDSMTGLYNRQEFEANLEKEFHRARRYIYNFTIAFIDIDNMNGVNEKYGQRFGDFVIYELSALLREVFRRTDLVYRFGGDKIIVFMPMTPISKSVIPIERLRSKISEYEFRKGDVSTNITVSVGLCANYSRFTEPEQILNALKISLSRAKETGRNKVDIYE